MDFETKYEIWESHQFPKPPSYVKKVLAIFWEENQFIRGDFLNSVYWDDRSHKLIEKVSRVYS